MFEDYSPAYERANAVEVRLGLARRPLTALSLLEAFQDSLVVFVQLGSCVRMRELHQAQHEVAEEASHAHELATREAGGPGLPQLAVVEAEQAVMETAAEGAQQRHQHSLTRTLRLGESSAGMRQSGEERRAAGVTQAKAKCPDFGQETGAVTNGMQEAESETLSN